MYNAKQIYRYTNNFSIIEISFGKSYFKQKVVTHRMSSILCDEDAFSPIKEASKHKYIKTWKDFKVFIIIR